jgi:hypothetical protein
VPDRRPRLVTAGVVVGLTAVVALPLLVALGVLSSPRWFPYIDLAQTEMRVRDVWSGHPPLIGLPGRIRGAGVGGSHPGPLSFYALWPLYRAFGADGWALQVASVGSHLVAVALAIWIGVRRGGTRLALVVAATLVLLLRAYGAALLAQPWNPQIPVVWWVVFLLAVWSVLCDDLAMLPIAVLAGTLCMQTHVSYLGVVGGLGGFTLAAALYALWRRRSDAAFRARFLRWAGGSAALLVLLWVPPLVQQLTSHPGNLRVLTDNFRHPYDKQVSFDFAYRSWLRHLDPAELVGADRRPIGRLVFGFQAASTRPGIAVLGVWLVAVALAAWRRDRALLRLHTVVAVALVLGLATTSRIFGPPWYYLTLWAWGTTALMLLATAWTFLCTFTSARRGRVATTVAAGATLLVFTALFTVDAAYTEMPNASLSARVRAVSLATSRALARDPLGCGRTCRYLVTWRDFGGRPALEDGVALALERWGFDARVRPQLATAVGRRRVASADDCDATIVIAFGDGTIAREGARPGARELARVDLRPPAAVFMVDVRTRPRQRRAAGAAMARASTASIAGASPGRAK